MILYVLSVSLILTGCLIFYKLLLQKETFFPLNRAVLMVCLILSFGLPLIPLPQEFSFRKAAEPVVQQLSTESFPPGSQVETPNVGNPGAVSPGRQESFFERLSFKDIVIGVYWLGVIIFSVNFLVQLFTLLYRAYSRPVIKDGKFRIVELSGDQAPCSFGNNIFINPEKYDWDTYSQILIHEKIHVRQGHSYDILLAELALVFQWFNPFAWFYRRAVEDNLEFLTDNELLSDSEIEPSSYKVSLVKVSAPHFPVSLTTNYNQSILKKRLIMMNAKKSNINSTWKYLFILPLLVLFVCLLNEPVAYGKSKDDKLVEANSLGTIQNEGVWFATIKNSKVLMRLEQDQEGENTSTHTFDIDELKTIPRGTEGTFSIVRDAGKIQFTGKFDGNMGMGRYQFVADPDFMKTMKAEGVEMNEGSDPIVFFLIDINRNYVGMLKRAGFTDIDKDKLIPLAALKVDEAYIKSMKEAGVDGLTLDDLIPLKSLAVDAAYVKDIKSAGYKSVSAGKLISLKSQGIDGDFIKTSRAVSNKSETPTKVNTEVEPISRRTNTTQSDDEGDEDLTELGLLIAKKALNITADYAKGFQDIGFKVTDEELISLKSLGVTPSFIKSLTAEGFKNISSEEAISLKSLGISAEEVGAYKKLGYPNIKIEEIVSAKATGTTPEYVQEMRKKGKNFSSLEKYIEFKVLSNFVD